MKSTSTALLAGALGMALLIIVASPAQAAPLTPAQKVQLGNIIRDHLHPEKVPPPNGPTHLNDPDLQGFREALAAFLAEHHLDTADQNLPLIVEIDDVEFTVRIRVMVNGGSITVTGASTDIDISVGGDASSAGGEGGSVTVTSGSTSHGGAIVGLGGRGGDSTSEAGKGGSVKITGKGGGDVAGQGGPAGDGGEEGATGGKAETEALHGDGNQDAVSEGGPGGSPNDPENEGGKGGRADAKTADGDGDDDGEPPADDPTTVRGSSPGRDGTEGTPASDGPPPVAVVPGTHGTGARASASSQNGSSGVRGDSASNRNP